MEWKEGDCAYETDGVTEVFHARDGSCRRKGEGEGQEGKEIAAVEHLTKRVEHSILQAFLPEGYPHSVSRDYLDYQIYDTLQAFCSSLTGQIATKSLLKGMGVGDSSADVTSAALSWIIRDGTGMLGRVLFATFVGVRLDSESKRWRFVADVLNDIAIFLDLFSGEFVVLVASLFGTNLRSVSFILIVCLSSLLRAVVGVAGSATRTSIIHHQAKWDNIADVSAKDGSQETAVNLFSLFLSLFLLPLLSGLSLYWTYGLFVTLTVFHLYFNYRAIRSLCLSTLNRERYSILLDNFINKNEILSPIEVQSKEKIWKFNEWSDIEIVFGCRLTQIARDIKELDYLSEAFIGEQFIVRAYRSAATKNQKEKEESRPINKICVLFKDGIGEMGLLRSYFLASILRHQQHLTERQALDKMNKEFDKFLVGLRMKEWNVFRSLLRPSLWRAKIKLNENIKLSDIQNRNKSE